MVRVDHFAHEHGADCPFRTEAKSLHSLSDQQLLKVLSKRGGECGHTEPSYGDL